MSIPSFVPSTLSFNEEQTFQWIFTNNNKENRKGGGMVHLVGLLIVQGELSKLPLE